MMKLKFLFVGLFLFNLTLASLLDASTPSFSDKQDYDEEEMVVSPLTPEQYFDIAEAHYKAGRCLLAATYYRLAADGKHPKAEYETGCFLINNGILEGINYLKKAAEHGCEKAWNVLNVLADKKNKYAAYALGLLYMCVKKESSKAVDYFVRAANSEAPQAAYALAICYVNGNGVEKNKNKAFEYFDMAAKQGYPEALYEVARHYENGVVVDKNLAAALNYYKQAARRGHERSILKVKAITQSTNESKECEIKMPIPHKTIVIDDSH